MVFFSGLVNQNFHLYSLILRYDGHKALKFEFCLCKCNTIHFQPLSCG